MNAKNQTTIRSGAALAPFVGRLIRLEIIGNERGTAETYIGVLKALADHAPVNAEPATTWVYLDDGREGGQRIIWDRPGDTVRVTVSVLDDGRDVDAEEACDGDGDEADDEQDRGVQGEDGPFVVDVGGVEVSTARMRDGAITVQIDTANVKVGQKIRVHVNDGTVFDGDPERDEVAPAPTQAMVYRAMNDGPAAALVERADGLWYARPSRTAAALEHPNARQVYTRATLLALGKTMSISQMLATFTDQS